MNKQLYDSHLSKKATWRNGILVETFALKKITHIFLYFCYLLMYSFVQKYKKSKRNSKMTHIFIVLVILLFEGIRGRGVG